MGTFDEQAVTVDVPTVREITRFELVVTKNNHTIEEEYTEEVDGVEVPMTRTVDDGGPDLDIFIYVGGERTHHKRQVPRDKVIAAWPGRLKAELVRIFTNAV